MCGGWEKRGGVVEVMMIFFLIKVENRKNKTGTKQRKIARGS